MRDVLSQASIDPRAEAPSGDDAQAAHIREALEGRFVCPFCGAVSEGHQTVCPKCTMENTPAARKATKARIGPWYVLQARNPAAPGMKWETLLAFVQKGRVKPQSIIRGPTTHQLWRFAAHVKGLSREFGVCYSCGGAIEPSANLCSQCNRLQEPSLNPDTLLDSPEPEPRLPVFKEIPAAQAHAAQLAQAAVAAPVSSQADEREQAGLREQRESAAREREELLRQREEVLRERERDDIARQLEAVALERDSVHEVKRSAAGELDAVKSGQETIARDREAAARERELAAQEREMIERDREAAAHERLIVEQEREMIQREREAASTERLTAAQERETIERDRLALAAEREAVVRDRDAAARDREAAAKEREAVARERDAATRERESLHREMAEAAGKSESASEPAEPAPASELRPKPPVPQHVAGGEFHANPVVEHHAEEPDALAVEEASEDPSDKGKSVWDMADAPSPHKASQPLTTPFASAGEKAGSADAANLRPRPRDGFLSAKDLAAAFKLNFEPSAQYDAAQELLADLAPDPLSGLRAPGATGASGRASPARGWKWLAYLIILAGVAAAVLAIDPSLRDRVRGLWSTPATNAAVPGSNPMAPPVKSAPSVKSTPGLKPTPALKSAPAVDEHDSGTEISPSATGTGPAALLAHAVPATAPSARIQSAAPPTPVPSARAQPISTPDVATAAVSPATAPASNADSGTVPEPLPADPRQRSRILYRAAIDAEDRNDFAQASNLYEQIHRLPAEDWPPDLATRLKLARQQSHE
ncbi:MAG TPA: hypothetical protein VFC78_09025 [Tepidisphaeraceae bacterium]|nr:hypothetical protein [Tepidisphaeraceae bacterium]